MGEKGGEEEENRFGCGCGADRKRRREERRWREGPGGEERGGEGRGDQTEGTGGQETKRKLTRNIFGGWAGRLAGRDIGQRRALDPSFADCILMCYLATSSVKMFFF